MTSGPSGSSAHTVAPEPLPPGRPAEPVEITRRDVELAGGITDLPTFTELFAQMVLALWRGDRRRRWLYRETLVRRFLRKQREMRA